LIRSYRGKFIEQIANGKAPKGFPADIVRVAERKLRALNNAIVLDDLRSPPGNHLELLSGDRQGQYSIRINDKWRICFAWNEPHADDVEIVDYH